MLDILSRFVATYGYVAIAVFLGLGSAGLPMPGETALLVAGAYAATGQLSITLVIVVATLSVIIGDAAGYWMGRRGGRPLLERYGPWLRLDSARIEKIEVFFARHGPKTVFFGRFISGLQTYAALFAGISRMPFRTFTVFNVLGGIVWAILYSALGYVFGRNLDRVERIVRTAGLALSLTVGLSLGVVLVWRWIAHHQAELMAWRDALLARPRIARLRTRYRRQLDWLHARLTPGQYLGLHFTLGLLVSVGCLWLLGGVAEDIIHNDPLVRFDQAVATTLQHWATPLATAIFILVTELGFPVVIALGIIVPVVYALRRHWLHVAAWSAALGGGTVLNLLLKQILHRPRPAFLDPLIGATNYSFPSGHAMASLIAYGMLAYFAVLRLRTWHARTAVICGVALLVLLIGFSRLYLGVHYFSDVVAGYAAGGVWLSTCITGMELVRRGDIRSGLSGPSRDTVDDVRKRSDQQQGASARSH